MNKVKSMPMSLVAANNYKKIISSSEEEFKSKAFLNLKPNNGEKILDIGCGDGLLSLQIKNLGCHVVGIDVNQERLDIARERGIEALQVSAEEMFFDKEFDVVFSSSALHWMRQPDIVLEAINRALKLGGRFVAEMSAYGNLKAVFDAFLETLEECDKYGLYLIPWYLPTEEDYRRRLEEKGFHVKKIETTSKNFAINGSLHTLVQKFLPIFNEIVDDKQDFVDNVVKKLENRLEKKSDKYLLNYVSIDFIAIKEKEIV